MACRRAADSCHTSKGLFPLPQMLSGKIPNASSIVLCFHTPSPLGWRTPQNAISASLKDSKAVWHRHFLLHMFVLSGMCVDCCFMSIWFMICSYPRSVSLNSFSFFSMDVMFLPSPSHYQTRVFCTHTSGGPLTTQALKGALISLVFFQSNFFLMFHLTCLKYSMYLKAQKTTWFKSKVCQEAEQSRVSDLVILYSLFWTSSLKYILFLPAQL